MRVLRFRRFSTLLSSVARTSASVNPNLDVTLRNRKWNPIPIPHRSIPEPRGQDLDFVNVVHSHLIHSDWTKLDCLSSGLTAFRVKHILLKSRKDYVLSLEFFNWVTTQNPSSHTLETHCIILHILAKHRKFKSAESILRSIIDSCSIEFPSKLFESLLYSYRVCDSSPHVFDLLFKTFAHLKKYRNASDTFCKMKDYGFLPTVESCNAFLSSLINFNRGDIASTFYREMRRCRISPNSYTLNLVICASCKLGRLDKANEVFEEMKTMGFSPNVASYNTLIAGNCNKGLLSSAMKLRSTMERNGVLPDVVTFNTLINGFCKDGKLQEASKLFGEMKAMSLSPTTITYNTLINGYSKMGNTDMGNRLFEEMSRFQVKPDILTYNALILGLCKEGKTKNAAFLVRELDRKKLVPNASTFSALICGQCVRKNSERAFQIYNTMMKSGFSPCDQTFRMLLTTFLDNEDYDGAVQLLKDMVKRHRAPDLDNLCELCVGLGRCGNGKIAIMLCSELEAQHLLPEGFDKLKVFNLLHNG
ncbi:pentatricopeptide repeat-containing protein At4g26680, mitochondrial [Cucurbita maxima]|uniref:Pentatricopeptide repeat-containing protein At4g26680, mitochondrial n=1 Tax=Cucurbita maxima TaxID=3661 RepID=A0A6J1JCA5_CUCMA|nr:pentatricopeptide repeat-containing protein At4g26680, mitochondrial [Cucurbita maxima]